MGELIFGGIQIYISRVIGAMSGHKISAKKTDSKSILLRFTDREISEVIGVPLGSVETVPVLFRFLFRSFGTRE